MTCVMWLSDSLLGYSMWLSDIFAGLQCRVVISDAFFWVMTSVVWLSDAIAGLQRCVAISDAFSGLCQV